MSWAPGKLSFGNRLLFYNLDLIATMTLASSVMFFYCFIQLILAVCYIYIVVVNNVDTVKAAEHLQFLCIFLFSICHHI